MPKSTLALLVTLAACHDRVIAVQPAHEPPAPPAPGQTTVTGTATLEVSPDCADLTMTLSADAARPDAATTQVEAKERAIVAGLGKLGVGAGDLKLSNLTLEPIYEPTPKGWIEPIRVHSYRATITVTATTRDFTKVAPLMEAGAEAGASAMSSQFRRSNMAEMKKQVRAMALAAAKTKAQQTADVLGIKLGRVLSVAENEGGSMWSQEYFPQVANAAELANGGVPLGGTLQPLTLNVTVGYELAREI